MSKSLIEMKKDRWCMRALHQLEGVSPSGCGGTLTRSIEEGGQRNIYKRWELCSNGLNKCVCRGRKYEYGKLKPIREQLEGYNMSVCPHFLPTESYLKLRRYYGLEEL